MMGVSLVLIFSLFSLSSSATDPFYDHQTRTYASQISPLDLSSFSLDVVPVFSPDHSSSILVSLIQSSRFSVDILVSNFKSWVGCTTPSVDNCVGCTASFIRSNETFPLFPALLNALHRGVRVRIVITDLMPPTCDDVMDLLTFLQLAGAEIRYFSTLTFLHDKFVLIDAFSSSNDSSPSLLISSINFSHDAFQYNREAGLWLTLTSIETRNALVQFYQHVFLVDWNLAFSKQRPHYSKEQMDVITDKSLVPVQLPPLHPFPKSCGAISPTWKGKVHVEDATFFVGPDYALDRMLEGLESAQQSIVVSMYQISDPNIVDVLIRKNNEENVSVSILVSCAVRQESDRIESFQAYNRLRENNITVRMAKLGCMMYYHAKFWIVDGEDLWLSSGNWSPCDTPDKSIFVSFGEDPKEWMEVNRNNNIRLKVGKNDDELIRLFSKVFWSDYGLGFDFVGGKGYLGRDSCWEK